MLLINIMPEIICNDPLKAFLFQNCFALKNNKYYFDLILNGA